MKIEVKKIENKDKQVLVNLFQLYLHDITKSLSMDVNSHGLFEYNEIDLYFLNDEDRKPYFIYVDDKIAGFVLVDKEFLVLDKKENTYDISEFFILNSYKRKGIGKKVAKEIFDMHRGSWEVRPVPRSDEAFSFWKNIIEEYTNNNYEIHEIEGDSRKSITFEN